VTDERRTLAQTFDTVAELYDRARPSYPAALFDDLAELAELEAGARVLEIGPGTGQATRTLVDRGYRVTALEPGAALAAVARRNVPDAIVVDRTFEDWEPDGAYDAVVAFTAWHWVDPDVRYRKAAGVARSVAVIGTHHVHPQDADPFFEEIQDVYEEIGEGRGRPQPPETVADLREEMEAGGLAHVGERRYLWERPYTAESYIAVLETYSGHRTMAPDVREHLYEEIRRRVGSGTIRKHYLTTLDVGRRIP
jgi:SAM-dependent methyltransferase